MAWAILNGEERAGATLHYMTENFDAGAVLAQTAVPVTPETTARELYDAVGEAAVQLFADCYPALLAGTLNAQGQDLSKKLYYSNKSIDFERDRRIDWGRPGIEIQRRICAFSFEPFQLPLTSVLLPDARRLQVTVSRTRLVRDRERSAAPGWAGRVVEVTTSRGLVVGTGSDDLVEIGLLDDRTPLDLLGSLGLGPGDIRLCNIEDVSIMFAAMGVDGMTRPYLSFSVLCYNEVDSIEPMAQLCSDVLDACGKSYELVLVDDGSTDGSRDLIRRLQGELPRCRAIYHPKNLGIGAGIRTCYFKTRGEWATWFPADLQANPRELPRLLREFTVESERLGESSPATVEDIRERRGPGRLQTVTNGNLEPLPRRHRPSGPR